MPTRLMGPCKTPLCPNTRTQRCAFCASCTAAGNSTDDYRGSAAARGYGHNWRKLRLMVLRRNPLCVDPFNIRCVSASLHADHIIPKRQGGEDILENLQGLCDSCHSRKTLVEQAFTFCLPCDGTPAMFICCGRVIQLFTATSAPPEAKPIAAWTRAAACSAWGQGWVESLEPFPARPHVGNAHVVAK